MSAITLFITGISTGLVAGGASCAAVQGGLLAGAVARRGVHPIPAPRHQPAAALVGVGSAADPPSAPPEPADPEPGAEGPQIPPVGGLVGAVRESAGPLGAFLSAKLVSHTVLGALLGAVGAAAQPGPRTRAYLLLGAAVLMVGFGLNLLGVPGFRGLTPRVPASWTRRVRRGARSESMFAPALLGLLTVLLPCGVTLSMALLAITSTSPVAGAAVMGGFVLGTAPLFAVLGFLLRASTRVLRGRLSLLTGVAVLAVAVWTSHSALRLGGWAFQGGSGVVPAAAASALSTAKDGTQVVTVTVHETSYTPSAVQVRPGLRTQLVLVTAGIRGCTSTFVIPKRNLQKQLPATGRTVVDLGVLKPGVLRWTCGLGMYGGHLNIGRTSA
jgi:sulfite exporter TauE/SafE